MPFKGYIPTADHRRNLSIANKGTNNNGENNPMYGKHHSDTTKLKISLAKIGKKDTDETRKKKSLARIGSNNPNYGKHWSTEVKQKIGLSNTGKKLSEETKAKMRLNHYDNSGEKSHFWKGGIYPEYLLLRQGFKAKQWRNKVFERDDYTCQKCNIRGGFLHSHHIKSFKYFSELRFDIDNGITLCRDCHVELHKVKPLDSECLLWT